MGRLDANVLKRRTDNLIREFSLDAAQKWLTYLCNGFAKEAKARQFGVDDDGLFRKHGVRHVGKVGTTWFKEKKEDALPREMQVYLIEMEALGRGTQRKAQFACAKRVIAKWARGEANPRLEQAGYLFFFRAASDTNLTRVSLITPTGEGETENFRRQSFLLDATKENGTFRKLFATEITRFGRLGESDAKRESLLARFSVAALTKEFYESLFAWYLWAATPEMKVSYPDTRALEAKKEAEPDKKKKDELEKEKQTLLNSHLICLITRLMFIWFVRAKDTALMPEALFDATALNGKILKHLDPTSSTECNYYNAILQNLFFATLNKDQAERTFAGSGGGWRDPDYGDKTIFRDTGSIRDLKRGVCASWFKVSHEEVLKLFAPVPYLNGGLFECQDNECGDKKDKNELRHDGFSREPDRRAKLPNALFFGDGEHEGLLELLRRYEFTIDENHATDADVALDPELLGKVFENLLAAYNPETGDTARKASGSFYTPREIVEYMVDEALRSALGQRVPAPAVDTLLAGDADAIAKLPQTTRTALIEALNDLKTLDPACGSGAFPMGLLNRMVELFESLGDTRDVYTRKLHIIEHCIYGGDIQPIAAQISKLRFFISLLCDIPVRREEPNAGLPQLPNLEMHFVVADSLCYLETSYDLLMISETVKKKRQELFDLRQRYLREPRRRTKLEIQERDKALVDELITLLREIGLGSTDTLLSWNPYDVNNVAEFFDAEWMFGFKDFDIVIGNPPYVVVKSDNPLKAYYEKHYVSAKGGKKDLYRLFFERGINSLKPNGCLSFITPNSFLSGTASAALRKFFFENVTILSLLEYSEKEKVFENVTQAVVVSVMERRKAPEGHTIKMHTERQGDVIAYQDALRMRDCLIPADPVVSRVGAMTSLLEDFLDGAQGEVNVSTKRDLYSTERKEGALPMWRGDYVGRFVNVATPSEFCQLAATSRDHWKYRRILTQQCSNQSQRYRTKACLIDAGMLCGHSTNYLFKDGITDEEILYWLGILNSKLFDYVFNYANPTNNIPIGKLRKMPVPAPTAEAMAEVAPIVDALIQNKQRDISADTSDLEERLDAVVYRLYGLTAEEIELVKRSFGRVAKPLAVEAPEPPRAVAEPAEVPEHMRWGRIVSDDDDDIDEL